MAGGGGAQMPGWMKVDGEVGASFVLLAAHLIALLCRLHFFIFFIILSY